VSVTYTEEVADLVDSFVYELCGECLRDVEDHVISPDMFGHPHAWCKS
jgi:hypothetical protein